MVCKFLKIGKCQRKFYKKLVWIQRHSSPPALAGAVLEASRHRKAPPLYTHISQNGIFDTTPPCNLRESKKVVPCTVCRWGWRLCWWGVGGSKSIALSALTSPPLFSVAKTRFIPKVSFLKLFVCCGVSVRCRWSSCFRLICSGGSDFFPSALLLSFSE